MSSLRLAFALPFALLALAHPARAEPTAPAVLSGPMVDAETMADVRCLAVAFTMVTSSDAQQRSAGTMAALYYLGRVDGRSPGLDLETLFVGEVEGLTGSALANEVHRCSAQLSGRGRDMMDLGARIQQRARSGDIGT